MGKKAYLYQAHALQRWISRKRMQIEKLRAVAEKTTASVSETPKSPSGGTDRMEAAICDIAVLEDEIHQMEIQLDEIRERIETVQDPLLQDLLVYRYLQYLPWNEVAACLGYSERQTHRLHQKALEKMK